MSKRHATASALAEAIAQEVRRRRKLNGWSLDVLAEKAGLSKSYVWAIENGDASNPTIDTALRLSRALACSMDELCSIGSAEIDLHPEARRIACEIDGLLRGKQKRKST